MNLQALANLGELVAGVGVIVSLVYLSLQVRQNTLSIRAATYHELVTSSRDILSHLFSGPDFLEFFHRVARDPGKMSEMDELRWHATMLSVFRHMDDLIYQQKAGTLESNLWHGYSRVFASWLEYPAFREWYEPRREWFSSDLANWTASHVPEASSTTARSSFTQRQEIP